jgi:hypothetical protein
MIYKVRNLVQQELLVDNDSSIHQFGSQGTYTYNGRINYYDIGQQYFKGFNWDYFKWEDSNSSSKIETYNGVSNAVGVVLGGKTRVIIGVEIKNRGVVYSEVQIDGTLFGSAMLSYPDVLAQKMTIYVQRPNDTLINGESLYGDYPIERLLELPLKEHTMLNIAYYLNVELDPIIGVKREALSVSESLLITTGLSRSLVAYNHNELRTSEVGNPLEVLYQNILQIGQDKILNVGSIVMNVSNENFGQYPLFVFTESGIKALSIGSSDAAYTNINPLAFGEAVTSRMLCETPYGLVYVGKNGLYFISGTDAKLLTKPVEEPPDRLNIEFKPEMLPALRLFTSDADGGSFTKYIQTADCMWYDNINNELSIWRSGSVGWTISMSDGTMYRNSMLPNLPVKNHVGNSLWLNSLGEVIDMQDVSSVKADGSRMTVEVNFVTRPLTYGTPDMKVLERMILRGYVYKSGLKPVVVTWYSDDSRNFRISKGLRLSSVNYKDVDTGMYGRRKYRSYMIGFGGEVGYETRFSYLETETEVAYASTKMR